MEQESRLGKRVEELICLIFLWFAFTIVVCVAAVVKIYVAMFALGRQLNCAALLPFQSTINIHTIYSKGTRSKGLYQSAGKLRSCLEAPQGWRRLRMLRLRSRSVTMTKLLQTLD